MITTKIMENVKATFERTGQDLELTYNNFKDQLTPKEIYDICINKAEVKDELPKEDLNGNRLNPFVYAYKDEKKTVKGLNPDFKVTKSSDILINTEEDTSDSKDNFVIVDGTKEKEKPVVEVNPTSTVRPAMVISTKEDTLNYESVGFAIGFKNADADDLLAMANGNALRLVPALQWLYSQTDDEGLRNRIEEITLDVLFDK